MAVARPIRAVLMSADIKTDGTGFHRLTFKVEGGRAGMSSVAVNISQDAHRKITVQMNRGRHPQYQRDVLLKVWARWAITLRMEDLGVIPATITITASDIDDFGGYANALGDALKAG
jgi:hypothetical protein